jgi:hypothetical protein
MFLRLTFDWLHLDHEIRHSNHPPQETLEARNLAQLQANLLNSSIRVQIFSTRLGKTSLVRFFLLSKISTTLLSPIPGRSLDETLMLLTCLFVVLEKLNLLKTWKLPPKKPKR